MSEQLPSEQTRTAHLVQSTFRLRADQKRRLEEESRAKGGTPADALRDNLDLAFAMKSELASIAVGEYDENDPNNTTMLVHSLLFRVEERLLTAFDELAKSITVIKMRGVEDKVPFHPIELADSFFALFTKQNEYPTTVWIGAFLEIVPRLSLLNSQQIEELRKKGEQWLE